MNGILENELIASNAYYRVNLKLKPIAYWPQWEPGGLITTDISGYNRDGTYTAVTLGQPGIGDGNTSPRYDGATSYTDVQTASFASAFNGDAGTIVIPTRVFNNAVWSDGAFRRVFSFIANGNNYVSIWKAAAANTLRFIYVSGGTVLFVDRAATTELDWMLLSITWDAAAGATGEMKAYYDGAQTGATQINLGVWAGALATSFIGASSAVPGQVWNGWLAHCLVLDYALDDTGQGALYDAFGNLQ